MTCILLSYQWCTTFLNTNIEKKHQYTGVDTDSNYRIPKFESPYRNSLEEKYQQMSESWSCQNSRILSDRSLIHPWFLSHLPFPIVFQSIVHVKTTFPDKKNETYFLRIYHFNAIYPPLKGSFITSDLASYVVISHRHSNKKVVGWKVHSEH